jgi:hypothetical protein
MPEIKIAHVPKERFLNNPDNPRKFDEKSVAKMIDSIREFPEMLEKRPLVYYRDENDNYIVLGGNLRLHAVQQIDEMDTVPAIDATDWDEAKRNEFIIKDNVSLGVWDYEVLQLEWPEIDLESWGVELPEWFDFDEKKEIDEIIQKVIEEEKTYESISLSITFQSKADRDRVKKWFKSADLTAGEALLEYIDQAEPTKK